MRKIGNVDPKYGYAKAGCYLCHSPNDCIDVEMDIEGEGAICICSKCGLKIAELIGCAMPEAVSTVKESNKKLREVVSSLKQALDSKQALIDALLNVESKNGPGVVAPVPIP